MLTKLKRQGIKRKLKMNKSFVPYPQKKKQGINISTEHKVIGGIALSTVLILVIGIYFISLQQSKESSIPEEEVISRSGIHWHPQLSIYIKGKQQEIPKDFGIGAVHLPIHTHDSSGTLHLEMGGTVTRDKIKLGHFFQLWSKEFNSTQIFDKKNGEEGRVKMFVNGKENTEFENYLMKDKDNIEIRYE